LRRRSRPTSKEGPRGARYRAAGDVGHDRLRPRPGGSRKDLRGRPRISWGACGVFGREDGRAGREPSLEYLGGRAESSEEKTDGLGRSRLAQRGKEDRVVCLALESWRTRPRSRCSRGWASWERLQEGEALGRHGDCPRRKRLRGRDGAEVAAEAGR